MIPKFPSDIGHFLLCDWLEIEEVRDLDTAICNDEDRPILLALLASPELLFSGRKNMKLIKSETSYMYWLCLRKFSMKHLVLLDPIVTLNDIFQYYIGCDNIGNKITNRTESIEIRKCKHITYETGRIVLDCKERKMLNFTFLSNLTRYCPSLTELILNDCVISTLEKRLPVHLKTHFTKLTRLDVMGTKMAFSTFLKLFGPCDKLTHLAINFGHFITADGMVDQLSYDEFDELFESFPLLSHLTVTFPYDLTFVALCLHCPHVTHLVAHMCQLLSNQSAVILAQSLPNIQQLIMFDYKAIDNAGLVKFGTNCPHITELAITAIPGTNEEGIISLLTSCMKIVKLDISRCCFSGYDVLSTAGAHNKFLTHLTIDNTRFFGECLVWIISECPTLQYLSARSTKMDLSHDDCLELLLTKTESLNVNTQMHTMDIQDSTGLSDQFILLLADLMPNLVRINAYNCKHVHMKSLRLRRSCTFESFITMFAKCSLLRELYLPEDIEISNTFVSAIVAHIPKLMRLGVHFCFKGDSIGGGYRAIKNALPHCVVLGTQKCTAYYGQSRNTNYGSQSFKPLEFATLGDDYNDVECELDDEGEPIYYN